MPRMRSCCARDVKPVLIRGLCRNFGMKLNDFASLFSMWCFGGLFLAFVRVCSPRQLLDKPYPFTDEQRSFVLSGRFEICRIQARLNLGACLLRSALVTSAWRFAMAPCGLRPTRGLAREASPTFRDSREAEVEEQPMLSDFAFFMQPRRPLLTQTMSLTTLSR